MPTYTQGVPMNEGLETGYQAYDPETGEAIWTFESMAPWRQQKYYDWKDEQEKMYQRYVDVVNQANAYRQSHYGDYGGVDMLTLGDTPDFSYGAYQAGEDWTSYAPDLDQFNVSRLFSRDEYGNFADNIIDPRGGQRAADGTVYAFGIVDAHNQFDRDWREANPDAWRERWGALSERSRNTARSTAEPTQVDAAEDTGSYTTQRSGNTPFLDSFMRARGITGAGPADTVVNTEYNPDGVIYDDLGPNGSGGIAGNRGMLSGQPQMGGTTPMPNQPMPTRIDPKPPVGRADGNAQDQRLNRPTPFADAFIRSRQASESRGPVSSLFSRFLKDD